MVALALATISNAAIVPLNPINDGVASSGADNLPLNSNYATAHNKSTAQGRGFYHHVGVIAVGSA